MIIKAMPFRDVEKLLLADGWCFYSAKGSHRQYKHPTKPGKVTVPYHPGDIDKDIIRSILRQAGLLL